MNEMQDEYTYYSKSGEKLKILYKVEDFLKNPTTHEILENEWDNTFRKTIEEQVIELIDREKEKQENIGTLLFRHDRGGQFAGELIAEIKSYVNPKYDLEIFYNNPELAKNFVSN